MNTPNEELTKLAKEISDQTWLLAEESKLEYSLARILERIRDNQRVMREKILGRVATVLNKGVEEGSVLDRFLEVQPTLPYEKYVSRRHVFVEKISNAIGDAYDTEFVFMGPFSEDKIVQMWDNIKESLEKILKEYLGITVTFREKQGTSPAQLSFKKIKKVEE